MRTVGDELLNEIERVSALREHYRGLPQDAGRFAIILMNQAIAEAKEQIKGDDPALAIRALKSLQEFTD